MSEIRWEEPPADRRCRGNWGPIAAELRANSGRWALVRENGTATTATSIKKGRIAAFAPAGSFDAVTRNITGGRGDIYARHVGGEAS